MSKRTNKEAGYSALELVIVVTFIGIVSVMATLSMSTVEVNKADQQALNLIDVVQEARQRSLSQRSTMRVEINSTDRVIEIINERDPLTAGDDLVIKTVGLIEGGVFIGTTPTNLSAAPTELSPTPPIAFATSVHPLSSGDSVATLRFLRNGTVTNAGNDAIGTGAVPTGATVYVWSKYPDDTTANPSTGQIFRAVTVLAASGLTRLWKCPTQNGYCSNWIK